MENNIANITEAEITAETNENETVKEEKVEETTAPQPKSVIGFVTGCKRLNIRKKPVVNNGNVIDIVEDGKELMIIEPDKAKGEWYKVQLTDDMFGFCMKQFVKVD